MAAVVLTPDEWAVFSRPVAGGGGHQGLLKRLLAGADAESRTVSLTDEDVERARRYAQKYGDGGFQGRFRILLTALDRGGACEGSY